MKKKKVLFLTIPIISLCVIGIILICIFSGKDKAKENTYAGLADTLIKSDAEEMSPVSKAFMQQVSFDIKNVDRDSMIATIDVSVPILTGTIDDLINKTNEENPDASYDELLDLTESRIAEALNNSEFETKVSTINVPYQKVDGKESIIPNDEFFDLVYGEMQEMYFDMLIEYAGGADNEEN